MFDKVNTLTSLNAMLDHNYKVLQRLAALKANMLTGAFVVNVCTETGEYQLESAVEPVRDLAMEEINKKILGIRTEIGRVLLRTKQVSAATYEEVMSECMEPVLDQMATQKCADSSGAVSASDTTSESKSLPEASPSTDDFTDIANDPFYSF